VAAALLGLVLLAARGSDQQGRTQDEDAGHDSDKRRAHD
jgi:hypothetical protein